MANEGKLTSQLVEVFQDQAPTGRLVSEFVEVFQDQAPTGRLVSEFVEVFQNQAATGRNVSMFAEVFRSFLTPVANVPDITGTTNALATFTSAASTGSLGDGTTLTNKLWTWTSVPGGSAVANIPPTPMPNNGGSGFISMASNAALYHCEGSGTDSSGNANTATFSNVTTGAGGKVGSFAWSFDTAAGIATLNSAVSLASDYTIAFWFYNLGPDNTYRSAADDSPLTRIIFIVEQTSGLLGVWTGSLQSSGFQMLAANYTGWHHIAAVGHASQTDFYVDGSFVGTSASKVTTNLKHLGNQIGQSQRFADRLDEIAIWTRALSAAEVSTLWLNQVGGYAGTGTTFGFTPDVPGTYTVQFSMGDSIIGGGPYTASANAVVTRLSNIGVWPMEQLGRMPNVQGNRLKRHRGQM